MNSQKPQSIDGFTARRLPRAERIATERAPTSNVRRTYAKPAAQAKPRRGLPEILQMPLIIGGAMLAGIFAQNAILGQLAVIAYGVAALAFGIASRTSFTLALLAMCATILLLVFKGDVVMSQNFAVYTFLFLVVGVITLNRELKKEGGRIYSIRKTHN